LLFFAFPFLSYFLLLSDFVYFRFLLVFNPSPRAASAATTRANKVLGAHSYRESLPTFAECALERGREWRVMAV
jgi:hypothetical protein